MTALSDIRYLEDFSLAVNNKLFGDTIDKITLPDIEFAQHVVTTSNGKLPIFRPKLENVLELSIEAHYLTPDLAIGLAAGGTAIWHATGGLPSAENPKDILNINCIFRGNIKSDKQGAMQRSESDFKKVITISLIDYTLSYTDKKFKSPYIHFAGSMLGGPMIYMNNPVNEDILTSIGIA